MVKKMFFICAALFFIFVNTAYAYAEVIIIGNSNLSFSSLSTAQVKKIYTGKLKSVDGVTVVLSEVSNLQDEFLKKYVGKSKKAYNKSWLKKIFAEGATAPTVFKNINELVEFVKSTPNAIGYVPSAVDGVKVLLK